MSLYVDTPSNHPGIVYKISMFAHIIGNQLFHDISSEEYLLHPDQKPLLTRLLELSGPPSAFFSCSSNPEDTKLIQKLFDNRVILPADEDETGYYYPLLVDIETNRHCNAQCVYCPQSESRKNKGVMSIGTFDKVLDRIKSYDVEWVAFTHYNEPFLDPYIRERIKKIRQFDLKLYLTTNGTLLSPQIIAFLEAGDLAGVIFNYPSLDPEEWSYFMQLPLHMFNQTKQHIEEFLIKFDKLDSLYIYVNGTTGNQETRRKSIEEHFSRFGNVMVVNQNSHNRAGSISNQYVNTYSHDNLDYFCGCERIACHLHVTWEGKCFLCCQDYYQQVILGDLRRHNIEEIMDSPEVKRLRGEIYGIYPMRLDLPCRQCVQLRQKRNVVVPIPY